MNAGCLCHIYFLFAFSFCSMAESTSFCLSKGSAVARPGLQQQRVMMMFSEMHPHGTHRQQR